MPQQFIKVKGSSRVISREAFSESVKKQDFSKCDSDSNYSNSTADICRICHCEADTENPLLSPCYCAGSLKYVHQNCLRQWLAASDTRSCELCKFNFILHTKIKPLSEWRILEMSSVERRRLLCAILFHFVAAVCVIWSLFVLIDRAAEEVQKGLIAWPFWTKLVVVAVGFTGGAVFMYIQCRQYLHLFSRWRAHNRIILVQNAPEKPSAIPPSPTYPYSKPFSHNIPNQIVTQVEYNVPQQNQHAAEQSNDIQVCYVFDLDRMASVQKADVHVEDLCDDSSPNSNNTEGVDVKHKIKTCGSHNFSVAGDSRVVSNDLVALDIELGASSSTTTKSNVKLNKNKTDTNCRKGGGHNDNMYKSLPNISTSSENLLV